jgi:ubiquitin-conjugating enzyme E2 Z
MSLEISTVKRLAKDVKYIIKNPLDSENIYYKHDEENILKGYALIIGNSDTPYEHGFYFFKFNFPKNYPHEPPEIKFLTNDGYMRFNPNLYTNGKVCLSVLNTWNGESWTSCQTIHSILLVLSSILNSNPLLNEPGINIDNAYVNTYNYLVHYKNIEFSILRQFYILDSHIRDLSNNLEEMNRNDTLANIIYKFKDVFFKRLSDNKLEIINYIDNLKNDTNYEQEYLYIRTYNLNCKININHVYHRIITMFDDLHKYL